MQRRPCCLGTAAHPSSHAAADQLSCCCLGVDQLSLFFLLEVHHLHDTLNAYTTAALQRSVMRYHVSAIMDHLRQQTGM